MKTVRSHRKGFEEAMTTLAGDVREERPHQALGEVASWRSWSHPGKPLHCCEETSLSRRSLPDLASVRWRHSLTVLRKLFCVDQDPSFILLNDHLDLLLPDKSEMWGFSVRLATMT